MRTSIAIAILLLGAFVLVPAAAPGAAASPGCTVDEDGADCSELEDELRRWLTCPGPNPLCWNGGP